MSRDVHAHLLPDLCTPERLRGGIAVVIDVLRASTTIMHALSAGAEAIVPCETIERARAWAADRPPADLLLGGERGGVPIEGFDLGNSPLEYTPERVRGKMVVFTTTNGTRALERSKQADRVLIGALVNRSAVVAELVDDDRPVHLVCAGTDGQVTSEDCLCAGAIAAGLEGAGGAIRPNDSARLCVDFWQARATSHGDLSKALCESTGGRNLLGLGMHEDVESAAGLDAFDFVPEFEPMTGRIGLHEPRIVRIGTGHES